MFVVEGCDAVGKTTAAKRLARERPEFEYVKLPDRSTRTGELLGDFIRGEHVFSRGDKRTDERAAQMLFALHNLEHRDALLARLLSGGSVVLDRYVLSGEVYHSQAVGEDAGAFIRELARGMPRPDCVVVLDADPAAAARRRADFGVERNDGLEIQTAVRAGFRAAAAAGGTALVDASRSPDEVFASVLALADAALAGPAPESELAFF